MKNIKFITIALGVTLVLTACGKNVDTTPDTFNTSETSQNVYEDSGVNDTYETEDSTSEEEEQPAKCPISINHYDVAHVDSVVKHKSVEDVNFITVKDMMDKYQVGEDAFMTMLYIYNDSKVESIVIGDTEIPIDTFRKAFVYNNLADSEDLHDFFKNFDSIHVLLADPVEANDENITSMLKEADEDYSKQYSQVLTVLSHYGEYEENEVGIEWNLMHYPETEPQIMIDIDNNLPLGDGYYAKGHMCAENHIVPIFIKCTDGTLIHNAMWTADPDVAITAPITIVDCNFDERDSL